MAAMKCRSYSRRVIQGVAAFDLLITGLLALPPSARWFIEILYRVNTWAGGGLPAPSPTPLGWLFVNLAGALGVLWALVRLRWPLRRLAWVDIGGRLWVAGLLGFYLVNPALPRTLLIFVITELGGAAIQRKAAGRVFGGFWKAPGMSAKKTRAGGRGGGAASE